MAGEVTGFLHIVRITGAVDPVIAEYRIAFAPLDGRLRGRRHVTRQGLDSLTDFLRRAGVPIPEIERTWQALARRRVHSIHFALIISSDESAGVGLVELGTGALFQQRGPGPRRGWRG